MTTPESDADLLIRYDSLLSLIRYREARQLTEQTVRELDELLRPLRARTGQIIRERRAPDEHEDRPAP